jgi:fucose 4-O-acetylase-like acetyltransferase
LEHADNPLSRAEQSRAEQSRAEQLENCNFIKVILMGFIVLYHSLAMWLPEGWFGMPAQASVSLGLIAQWLNSFHIYAFVLISGYIFAYLKFERNKYQNFTSLIKNKAKRLLIPYFFVAVVWLIPWDYAFQTESNQIAVSDYLLALSPSQLWFLWMMFGVFVLAYFLTGMMWKKPLWGLMISFVLYAVSIIGLRFIPNYFQIWYTCRFMMLFYTGMMIRKDRKGLIYKIPWYVWVAIDLLLFVLTEYCNAFENGIIIKLLHIGMPMLLHIIGAVMAFTTLNAFSGKINFKTNRLYLFFEKNNFTIYLFHQQIIYLVITLLNGKVPSGVLAICNFAIAIILSSLIAVVLNKWKLTRFLTGQKA